MKDHKPAHIHVIGPDAEAKIDIIDLNVIKSNGFSKKDITRILSFLKEYKEMLLEAWEDYHEE